LQEISRELIDFHFGSFFIFTNQNILIYYKGTIYLYSGGCMDRTILHVDMNAYYASVECFYHPELRDKPVAVAGDVEQRHGIILAKNQIAKKFGIATGEAIWQARQKCNALVTVPAHYDLYMQISKAARSIYERYTDRIEPFGLDENWMDITGNMSAKSSGEQVANELRTVITKELGITASVGVSWNKIFAKLGSDYKKPNATTVFSRENFKEKIWPLPASDLLYVGRATNRKLANYGIHTIGQLAETNPDFLRRQFGKWGEYLWAFATGHDLSPVSPTSYTSPIKSIGNSMTTYRDIENDSEAWQVIMALSESVASRLRENGFRCKTVQISVRDTDLLWFERQRKLTIPSCVAQKIATAAMQLFKENVRFVKPIRSLGVRGCDLVGLDSGFQITFFDNAARQEKREKIEGCIDGLRGRFGKTSVKRAVLLNADIIGESDPLTHEVHPVGFFK
jgi:DNA polymerase IV